MLITKKKKKKNSLKKERKKKVSIILNVWIPTKFYFPNQPIKKKYKCTLCFFLLHLNTKHRIWERKLFSRFSRTLT